MVPEPLPSEDAMPLSSDLDPEADQAVQDLLHGQPGLTMPAEVRRRILASLADEAATRAALYDNDTDPTPAPEPLIKTSKPEHQKLS